MNYYKRHQVAAITLPAVTIGADGHKPTEDDHAKWMSDVIVNHAVTLSIRVHTSFVGATKDRANTTLYIDQIIEELKENINLTDYRFMDFEVESYDEDFAESETNGGEIKIELHTVKKYVQA